MGVGIRVGFVGLGTIGSAMLERLVGAGHRVAVHDTFPPAVEAFAGRVDVHETNRSLAAVCDAIHVVVNDDAQVLDATLGDDGILAGAAPGTVIMIHSTIGHDTLRAVVAAAAPAGIEVLDAGISGERGQHSIPDLCVMVGGGAAAFERVRPLLETFASLVLHLGPSGAGLDAKLARNVMVYLWHLSVWEGFLLARQAGVPAETMRAIMTHTGLVAPPGGAASDDVSLLYPDGPPPELCRKMADMAKKDLRAAVARAAELGVELRGADASVPLMDSVLGRDHTIYGGALQ